MNRYYHHIIERHLSQDLRQMLFFSGPRQSGKTTVALSAETLTDSFHYLNWDNLDHQSVMIQGPAAVMQHLNLTLSAQKPIVVFDEIHKYPLWKNFLKGFFDTYGHQMLIIVTGSAKLDVFRQGGDSLMGRYFLYRVHPLSLRECVQTDLTPECIQPTTQISPELLDQLINFGGYPEPFLKKNEQFSRQWRALRHKQLIHEDIRDITHLRSLSKIELLAQFLELQAGQCTNYTQLSKKLGASVDSVQTWIQTLEEFYYCFKLQPWTKNVSRSLIKQPKIYVYDWSLLNDKGARHENFVAAHLHKAMHWWIDQGHGDFRLHYIRDKEKREVDFIVVKNNEPWCLIEVKSSKSTALSPSLQHFQKKLQVPHAFQVVFDLPMVNTDCFQAQQPMIIPVQNLLSQWV